MITFGDDLGPNDEIKLTLFDSADQFGSRPGTL